MPAKKKSRWVSRAVHDRVVDKLDKFAARMAQEKHDMRRETDQLVESANNAFKESQKRIEQSDQRVRAEAERVAAPLKVEGERLVRLITVAAAALDVINHAAVVGDANFFTVIAARNALAAALGPHQKAGPNGNLTPADILDRLVGCSMSAAEER